MCQVFAFHWFSSSMKRRSRWLTASLSSPVLSIHSWNLYCFNFQFNIVIHTHIRNSKLANFRVIELERSSMMQRLIARFRNDNGISPIATFHHVSCPSLLLRVLPRLTQARCLGSSLFRRAYVPTPFGSLASFASAARCSRKMFTNSGPRWLKLTEVIIEVEREIAFLQ